TPRHRQLLFPWEFSDHSDVRRFENKLSPKHFAEVCATPPGRFPALCDVQWYRAKEIVAVQLRALAAARIWAPHQEYRRAAGGSGGGQRAGKSRSYAYRASR